MKRIDEKYDESRFPDIWPKGDGALFFRKKDIVKILVSLVTLGFILKLDIENLAFPRIGTSGLESLFGALRFGTRGHRQALPRLLVGFLVDKSIKITL
jgi:hypothetical protein